jgi:hypothetical protein
LVLNSDGSFQATEWQEGNMLLYNYHNSDEQSHFDYENTSYHLDGSERMTIRTTIQNMDITSASTVQGRGPNETGYIYDIGYMTLCPSCKENMQATMGGLTGWCRLI